MLFIVRASPVRTLVRGDMNSPWLARPSANWISKVRFEGLWGMINIMQTQVRRRIHRCHVSNLEKFVPRTSLDTKPMLRLDGRYGWCSEQRLKYYYYVIINYYCAGRPRSGAPCAHPARTLSAHPARTTRPRAHHPARTPRAPPRAPRAHPRAPPRAPRAHPAHTPRAPRTQCARTRAHPGRRCPDDYM